MATCEQKIGIFTLKQCNKEGEYHCDECGKYFCDTHFTNLGVCRSCYSQRQNSSQLMESDGWYWATARRRHRYDAGDLELLTYSELMLDEVEMMRDEFDQDGMDADEFDEGDVSYFDS
ncbi:hypothetical protein [Flammeovirga aprica]|uniref:Uncharacterized protein n=1 Tax=Flammeovirga aprica JL-4 TaxID=694437 RepID=A0A7X9XBU2_9BACT|nr:hypothetical protein [Flammeovirga aprica]NME70949.1 hypothetical protein [Flammeovirga aprica JL-4]